MKQIFLFTCALAISSCASLSGPSAKEEQQASILMDAGTEDLYSGKYSEALHSLLIVVKLRPTYSEAWNNLGLAYAGKELWDKAEESWKKALSLDKNFSDVRNNLGILYMRQKKYKESEAEFREVIKDYLYAKSYQTQYNLGLLYLAQRKTTLAEQQFKLSVKADPTFCAPWFNLGNMEKERGDIEAATSSLKKSVSGTCYRNPEAHYQIGSLYLKKRDIQKAKAKFLEVIENFPQTEWAKKAETTLNMIH